MRSSGGSSAFTALGWGVGLVVGRRRSWWVALVGALLVGGSVWAVLRFGVPVFLTDETHSARPVLEALSWIAGIASMVAAVVALRQVRGRIGAQEVVTSPVSQTATAGGVNFTGTVTGGSGSGVTTGVHIGQVGGPPDPPVPTGP